ncbi:hypothetical protein JXC34_06720 [Candidatus Woesearchaeota archaeon]|nr:hypothetical protein [Candidatus Woesearchaeota archaeon]
MKKQQKESKAFFRKRLNPSTFILFALLIILFMIFFRKIAIFFVLTFLTSVFVYLNYYIKLPFDVSPVLFLSLIISREYSFLLGFLFIISSGIVPMVIAGGSFDHTTLFYLSIIILVNFMSAKMAVYPMLVVLIPLIILHHIVTLFGGINLLGMPAHKEIANFFTHIAVDCFYIFSFSSLIIGFI